MKISGAELEVMNVLWRNPRLAASDVFDALGDHKDWNIRTVKTLLARLVEKGALATEQQGRRYLYTPQVAQHDYKARAARQFVDRVFSGRAASEGLTDEDIAELEQLLGRLKNDTD